MLDGVSVLVIIDRLFRAYLFLSVILFCTLGLLGIELVLQAGVNGYQVLLLLNEYGEGVYEFVTVLVLLPGLLYWSYVIVKSSLSLFEQEVAE